MTVDEGAQINNHFNQFNNPLITPLENEEGAYFTMFKKIYSIY